MHYKPALKIFVCLLLAGTIHAQQPAAFSPGELWNDSEGRMINAHHGSVIEYNGLYYWYGEKITRADSTASKATYEGISCYVSADLLHWKNKGLVFSQATGNQFKAECPRVIYQKANKKLVMWVRLSFPDGRSAGLGVLISNAPTEPFTLVRTDTSSTYEPGEMTLFLDTDGKAYLFYAAGGSLIHAAELTGDYLDFTRKDIPVLNEKGRGAPVIFKHHGKYYLLTSSSPPYTHGKGRYAVADHIMDTFKTIGDPFMGPGEESAYQSRATFALSLRKTDVTFLYMADRWDLRHPERSTYVWLPMGVDEEGDLEIPWQKKWNFIK